MLFKFSSVLYFSKYHDSGRLQEAYSFSCFQGPCRLWRYLFLLLYMWQSTLALPALSLLRFVWLNFGLPFSGSCSQDFLVFSLPRGKEVFYASPRICSSVQNKDEPPAHFKKRSCSFLTLQKVTMVLKTMILRWHCRKPFLQLLCKNLTIVVTQFHTKYLASLTNQNARFYSIMRF